MTTFPQTIAYEPSQYLPFSAGPQLAPMGWFGDLLGSIGQPVGGAVGGLFGDPRLGSQIGGTVGNLAKQYLPFSAGPQIAPMGWFGDLLGSIGQPVGGAVGGLFGDPRLGSQIGGTVGNLAKQYLPFSAGPQLMPMGWFGDVLGSIGRPAGGIIGGWLGNAGLGGQIGGTVGDLAKQYLPFSAGPQLAPMGWFGDLLGSIGQPVGGAVGGLFGDPRLGSQIGGTVGNLAKQYLPFSAGPQLAPMGWFGDVLGSIGRPAGGIIGGWLGNAGLGGQIGGTVGDLAKQYLPFSAGPQLAPMGWFGDLLGSIGQPVGGAVGGLFGDPRLGSQIGGTVGNLAKQYLPFSAGPQLAPMGWLGSTGRRLSDFISDGWSGNPWLGSPIGGTVGDLAKQYLPFSAGPQLAPMGWFGDLLGSIGQPVGGAVGGLLGNAGLGSQIGGTVGNLARQYLPFSAGPQLAPMGWFGDLLGSIGQPVGGAVGGLFGDPRLGSQIGGIAGNLAKQYLPFSAGPQLAPMGWFGDVLGSIGRPAGGIIGGWLGNAGLGSQIGGTVGDLAKQYLPFSAGPQPYYY